MPLLYPPLRGKNASVQVVASPEPPSMKGVERLGSMSLNLFLFFGLFWNQKNLVVPLKSIIFFIVPSNVETIQVASIS